MTNNKSAVATGFVAGAAVGGSLASAFAAWWWWYLKQTKNNSKRGAAGRVPTTASASSSKDTAEAASNDLIYMDYNGTTPVYPEVVHAMLPYFQQYYGNPNSSHAAGDAPRAAVNVARRQILTHVLGCDESVPLSSCIFTSCGTESDNLALHLALLSKYNHHHDKDRKTIPLPHVVTCNVEHAAIDGCLAVYETSGRCTVTRVPVQPDGRVIARDMIAAIQPNTVLVTLMLANNESGALQPVKEVSEHCRKNGILVATDAAQAVGKLSTRLREDLGDPDMVAIVGHKIGAPKGIACLYVRPGCLAGGGTVKGLLIGGGQEFGQRGGTENVPYIVGMGVAAVNCIQNLPRNHQHMELMRSRLLTGLRDALGEDNVRVNGPEDPAHRLPNTLSVGFAGGVHSGKLLGAVRDRVAASAGATCHAATGPVSTVLQAMQVPEELARATLRLSLGPKTTADEVDRAAAILAQEVKRQLEANSII